MDSDIQKICNEAYANEELFPENASDGSKPQSAMVIMSPDNGDVLAMVGGREYEVQRGLNRAISLRRQPGSSIKPLMVFAPALKSGKYVAASILDDTAKTFETQYETYEPNNFGQKYYGQVTLRECVVKSLNVPAVEILDDIGINAGKRFAMSVGIPFESSDNGLSLALGGFSQGVSPLDLCGGYNALASGGTYHDATLVTKIENTSGSVLYQDKDTGTKVLGEGESFILTDMLTNVVTEGTGHRLRGDVQLAAKTGTNDYKGIGNRDAWMTAYNSEYTAVVWMGYDNTDDVHCLPSSCTGGNNPALVLKQVFDALYQDKQSPTLETPDNVMKVKLDKTALLEGTLAYAPEGAAEGTYVEDYILDTQTPKESPAPSQTQGNYTIFGFDVALNDTLAPVVTFQTSSALGSYAIFRQDASEPEAQLVAQFDYETDIHWIDTDVKERHGYTYYAAVIDENGEIIGKTTKKIFMLIQPGAGATPDVTLTPAETGPNETTLPEETAEPSPSPEDRKIHIGEEENSPELDSIEGEVLDYAT